MSNFEIFSLSSKSIATVFARKSLSVSLWSVVSFEGRGVGLRELAPLAELTGGAVRHCFLLESALSNPQLHSH